MTEAALDEFVGALRVRAQHSYLSGDGIVRSMWPYIPEGWRADILQDPRYIQHCEEQDRKEEGLTKITWITGKKDFITGLIIPD